MKLDITYFSKFLQVFIFLVVILYFGKTLFIPISFALLVSFILYPFYKRLLSKNLSRALSILISLFVVILVFGVFIYLSVYQFNQFKAEWLVLKSKLINLQNTIAIYLANNIGLTGVEQKVIITDLLKNSTNQIGNLFQNILVTLSASFFNFILIPIFSALILYHSNMLTKVLYSLFPSEQRPFIHEILIETVHAYYNFIKGMLMVYLIVGVLNSLGLYFIGIPHPFLFGFMASIFTFIPYVGIIMASILPISMAWLSFNSIWYPIGVIIIFTIVQFLEANIIFPKAVGNRLNINTLTILIAIILGGIIWGTAGMILFIPFVSIIKLIADRTESLKSLSLLLGTGDK